MKNKVDEYISKFPKDVQKKLKEIREAIKQSAPEAMETISYKIPTYKLNGNLVHFGAFKDHVSFFPTSSPIKVFKKELSKYKKSKGTIQFPFDNPIPLNLIRKITRYRVNESLKVTTVPEP